MVIAIVLLALILLFVGFLKHIVAMLFGKIPSGIKIGEENIWLIIPPFVLIVTALFLSFHIPAFLQTLINDVASRY